MKMRPAMMIMMSRKRERLVFMSTSESYPTTTRHAADEHLCCSIENVDSAGLGVFTSGLVHRIDDVNSEVDISAPSRTTRR